MSAAEIKKQVEYYLSDLNLQKDKFFNAKIKEAEDGWVPIALFLNCNKIKALKVKADKIVEALKDSKDVEAHADGMQIRRKDNKAVPELSGGNKKRDEKAESKAADKVENKEEEEVHDGFLIEEDFNSPHIVRFTPVKVEEGVKIDWKGLVEKIKAACPKIKIAYVRSDPQSGEIAVSKHRL